MVHGADERGLAAATAAPVAAASTATASLLLMVLRLAAATHLLLVAAVLTAAMTATASPPAASASSALGRLVLSLIHVVVLSIPHRLGAGASKNLAQRNYVSSASATCTPGWSCGCTLGWKLKLPGSSVSA